MLFDALICLKSSYLSDTGTGNILCKVKIKNKDSFCDKPVVCNAQHIGCPYTSNAEHTERRLLLNVQHIDFLPEITQTTKETEKILAWDFFLPLCFNEDSVLKTYS